MQVKETILRGCYVIKPKIFEDGRGYFYETFNQKIFEEKTGLNIKFVQDNESKSSKGVLRGLHYQVGEFAQAKLVRVVRGSIMDVVVDLRQESNTFGKHISVILTSEEKTQLFIPRGFAHGFLVLEDETIFSYKCDNFYKQESESGIIYNDKDLKIDWNFPESKMIISDKDKTLPTFKNVIS